MNRHGACTGKSIKSNKSDGMQIKYEYGQGMKANRAKGYRRFFWGIMVPSVALLTVVVLMLITNQGHAEIQTTAIPKAAMDVIAASPISAITPLSPAPMPAATPEVTAKPTVWGSKFPGKFTDGEVIRTDNAYKSSNINVTVTMVQENDLTYYLADIYMTDLKYLKTAFANDEFDNGAQNTLEIANKYSAVIAINGDYCSYNKGPVVRNGVLYRDQNYHDVLVLYNDGTMETYTKDEFNMESVQSKGAYQVWTFGPMLLNSGQPMTEFNSSLGKLNPRTAVGYYEPGHYCFIVVDGRQGSYSKGITFTDLSQLFYDLGCKTAFNLDGGQTAEMAFMGEFANRPFHGGRDVSDILYIADD